MIADTSLTAYEKISKDLPVCRLEVYKTIKKLEYCTNSMIAESLGWKINRITGRTSELKKMGLIHISHSSWCPVTHGKAHYLTITKFEEVK